MSEINGELALERDVCAILPLRALINVSPFWLALVYIPLTQGSVKIQCPSVKKQRPTARVVIHKGL